MSKLYQLLDDLTGRQFFLPNAVRELAVEADKELNVLIKTLEW